MVEHPFQDYLGTFIQRLPRYTVKPLGWGHWRTKHKALADMPIKAHLGGRYAVGVLSRWYPEYAILDMDATPIEATEEIRGRLGLDETNSMLCASENANSYPLLLRPEYNGRPPTIRLLHDVFRRFGRDNGVEVFPQVQRTIRLPFGPHQNCLDLQYRHLQDWQDKLYWFEKLGEFDLQTVPTHQMELDLQTPRATMPTILQEGNELLTHGLQIPSTRHEGQFKVLYLLWRLNVPQDEAEGITWRWIQAKHNGFSRDMVRYPGHVRKEIGRQAGRIWNKYELARAYPDSTHNTHTGYLTELDLREVIQICRGSSPRMRFLFHLVKHFYPRRHRTQVNVHRDKLVKWANERTYLRYLNELESIGIAKRGTGYEPGAFSKSLRLNWRYRDSREAVLYEGRAIETWESTIRLIYKPDDFRALLGGVGAKRTTVIEAVRRTFKVSKSATHI
jgi:hypothetical protein